MVNAKSLDAIGRCSVTSTLVIDNRTSTIFIVESPLVAVEYPKAAFLLTARSGQMLPFGYAPIIDVPGHRVIV